MKSIVKISLLILSALIVSCKSSVKDGTVLLITNANVIDARHGLRENMTVEIYKNKITDVREGESQQNGGRGTIIDAKGKYLIPGLWDTHVHFAYIEDLAPYMFDLFLYYGITSVRDTGGKISFVKEWKDRAEEQPGSAPRVMIAGPLIDGEPNVYDGSAPSRPELSVGNFNNEDIRRLINQLDSVGVDLLKAYEMLSPDQFAEVARLAKEKDLLLTGHVPLSMDVISASNLGLNSMEHLRNVEMSCASNSDELLVQRRKMLAAGSLEAGGALRSRIHRAQRMDAIRNQDPQKVETVLEALKNNDTYQVPTIALSTGSKTRYFEREEYQESFNLLPNEVKERWMEGVARMSEMEITEDNELYAEWAMNMIDEMNRKGVTIMAGTDCPIFFLTPGRSLHEELKLLVEAGLSNLEAIASATSIPAQYFRMQDQLGLIQEGMYADILILDADPLIDISNTRKIFAVIKDGVVYDRSKLIKEMNRDAVLETAN